mgnify:CR=1 FL=1
MKACRGITGAVLLVLLFSQFLSASSNRFKEDKEIKFYLSNYTNFTPGSEVSVSLYSYNVKDYEFSFRLFRITDMVRFFTEINRSALRGSFDILGENNESLLRYTVPVKDWKDKVADFKNSFRNNVQVGKIDEAGTYILQAANGKHVAYCSIVVSSLAMLYKYDSDKMIAFMADIQSSKFQPNVKFDVYNDSSKLAASSIAGSDGLSVMKLDSSSFRENTNYLVFANTGNEILVNDPGFYFDNNRQSYAVYTYTNQPVYRPGQEVFFKAILRQRESNKLINMPGMTFNISVKSNRNKEVYSGSLTTNEFGTLSGSFKLDEDADIGNYGIVLEREGAQFYCPFSVEEYKKPEFYVTVKTGKEHYAGKDVIKGTVNADYYFGSPVLNGKVTLRVFKSTFWRPWWYWSEYSWFYRSLEGGVSHARRSKILPYNGSDEVYNIEGELDSTGKFSFEFPTDSANDYDYVYNISAEVTDYSRREITGSKQVYVTRGSFSLSASTEKYFVKTGGEVKIRVNAVDFFNKPVSTKFKIAVHYPEPDRNKPNNKKAVRTDTLYGYTDVSGKSVLSFFPEYGKTGYFTYTVIAADEKDRIITANGSFFVGSKDDYWYYNNNEGLEIITDKESYEKGDSLVAYVFLPSENTQLLLTYETDRIISYKKMDVKEKSFVITESLDDKLTPGFNIGIMFTKGGQFYSTSQFIAVLDKSKMLNISIDKNKEQFKPGDSAVYNITVKDYKGLPVKNTELSVGLVDESIYAIREDETQPIHTAFLSPIYYYIPSGNTINRGSYNGGSRRSLYADYNTSGTIERGESILWGKITWPKDQMPAANPEILLNSESGFYKIKTDTSGKYRFTGIKDGEYEILFSFGTGSPFYMGTVKISGVTEFNHEVTEDDIEIQSIRNYGIMQKDISSLPESVVTESVAVQAGVVAGKTMARGAYVQPELRSNFVDAAFWQAHVVTGEDGKAAVRFKMPDNLTTWRASVKGVTTQTEVGETEDKVITRKNLLVRMETPRFFREGDEVTISTIIHNYLGEKKKAKISFKADSLSLISSKINTPGYSTVLYDEARGMYELNINGNSELRIDWRVKVTAPFGNAALTAEALTDEESDALKLSVPLLPKGYKEVNVLAADFSDPDKEEVLEFKIPEGVDLRSAGFSFSAAPSLAGTMLKALDELVAYPYGCVEQTMSRFLPAVIAANTFKNLGMSPKSETLDKLPKVVDAGLKKLYDFQHSDGGWGWWKNDESQPYMTAYVVYGLGLAMASGYDIKQDAVMRGIDNLKTRVRKNSKEIDRTTLSYIAYAMSGNMRSTDDRVFVDSLLTMLKKGTREPYSLALLTLASVNTGNKKLSSDYTAKLVKQVNEEKNFAFWGGQQFHYRWQDDKVQGTAFELKALLKTGGDSKLADKAVKWLLKQKRGFSWNSTQETASIIFALADYLKITKETSPQFTAEVYVNGTKAFDKSFTSANVFDEPVTVKINNTSTAAGLKNGTNTVRIVKHGEGKLYFTGLNEYYSKDRVTPVRDNSFRVKREYYILRPENEKGHIIYKKEKLLTKVKSGDNILVKTYVTSRKDNDMQYFMLEDMFPSGFEIVKEADSFNIKGENDYPYWGGYGYRPWRWFYADKEYRDEKASFFVTHTSDEMVFTYILKAQMPGRYSIMPATGSLMYYPEINGSSYIENVEVVE